MPINRKIFIKLSSLATAGVTFLGSSTRAFLNEIEDRQLNANRELYEIFKEPGNKYRPFVRWWWNGDRLQEKEILRELDLLKKAGVGGVEINPIRFPSLADPIGIPELEWLGEEWISMLRVALKGAKERGMICDMIVGSGWPFGGEFLKREEQSQMIALGTKDLPGNKTWEFSKAELLESVNPDIHSKYEDKLKELFIVKLAPATVNDLSKCVDLTDQIKNDRIKVVLPAGDYVLYYLVKLTGFMAVINGARGAGGPVLNHYSKPAVEKYLTRMSDKLTTSIGPLGNHFRAFFTDSLELEGANWCDDMSEQFRKRNGYDLIPYLPFILFKTGGMGNAVQEDYGAKFTSGLQQTINQVRYDFETTRMQLFKERFTETFVSWCRKNGVRSRMQAYGRECHPIEASMSVDIPECETWLGFKEGEIFSDEDYRGGRSYTMINKFVSSGAHLAGRKLISCEELTNTSVVFNASLEEIKIAGDQSNLSGVTHSILHGFNYSPLEAPFPGWVRYGTFINERNTWWPYFKNWIDYKARLSAIFQNAEMQADIAILHPLADLAMRFGFQRDPFPSFAYPPYQHQVWEAIHQNGGGCDYVSEKIIQQAEISNGHMVFGTRNYKVLLLIEVESMLPATAAVIKKFTAEGGKLICIGKAPRSSPSNQKGNGRDKPPAIDVLKNTIPANAGIFPAPEKDFISWYRRMQQQFDIKSYLKIYNPDRFVSQVHYKCEGKEIFFFINSNSKKEHLLKVGFDIKNKKPWLWDPETGKRSLFPQANKDGIIDILLGPSDSRLLIFEQEEKGEIYSPEIFNETAAVTIGGPWQLILKHVNGTSSSFSMQELTDLKEIEELKSFAGEIIYENSFQADGSNTCHLHLGETHGVSEIEINDQKTGIQWYGAPVHNISQKVKKGANTLRIKLTSTLGNYMKSLKDNETTQAWTKDQPLYPMGIIGPVRISTC